MHIQHIALRVRDLEKSIEFYETVADLKVMRRLKAGPGEVSFLSNGPCATEIELIFMPEQQFYEGQGMFICFATDKLDEMHKLVTEKGFNPSPIQEPDPDTRYFYVYDPDGVSVQLRWYPES